MRPHVHFGGRLSRLGRRPLVIASRVLLSAALAGTALLGASGTASAQSASWSVVTSPAPGSDSNQLNAVSCVSSTDCTAVGFFNGVISFVTQADALIESWNGSSWSAVSNPAATSGGMLNGVSCVSASSCVAVGITNSEQSLVESWNGSTWSVVPSPDPAGSSNESRLNAVSCVSASDCTAVGYQMTTTGYSNLVESWNGSTWSVVSAPNTGTYFYGDILTGVSCVSASDCTAVGYYSGDSIDDVTLIEQWNGSSWSVVSSPNEGGSSQSNTLNGVSCVSASDCTAVGTETNFAETSGSTLVESWNGSAWSVVSSPNESGSTPSQLNGVSCVSASDCTAVGVSTVDSAYQTSAETVVESWNGSTWSVVSSPNPAGSSGINQLYGVSCPSASQCTAAGYFVNSAGNYQTLVESN
jgi:hypothetical protein